MLPPLATPPSSFGIAVKAAFTLGSSLGMAVLGGGGAGGAHHRAPVMTGIAINRPRDFVNIWRFIMIRVAVRGPHAHICVVRDFYADHETRYHDGAVKRRDTDRPQQL